MQISVVLYRDETFNSKAGKAFIVQQMEIVQTPVAPNVVHRLFRNSAADVLAPGSYTCSVSFSTKGYDTLPKFFDFKPAK